MALRWLSEGKLVHADKNDAHISSLPGGMYLFMKLFFIYFMECTYDFNGMECVCCLEVRFECYIDALGTKIYNQERQMLEHYLCSKIWS